VALDGDLRTVAARPPSLRAPKLAVKARVLADSVLQQKGEQVQGNLPLLHPPGGRHGVALHHSRRDRPTLLKDAILGFDPG
jgi:hypothetical protein